MVPNIEILELNDLKLEVEYEVKRYKQIYGSCGLIFIIQIVKDNVDTYIAIRNGILYDYLKNKTDKSKFTIMRTNKDSAEPHIVMDNIGKWINLIPSN